MTDDGLPPTSTHATFNAAADAIRTYREVRARHLQQYEAATGDRRIRLSLAIGLIDRAISAERNDPEPRSLS